MLLANGTVVVNPAAAMGASVIVHNVSASHMRSGELGLFLLTSLEHAAADGSNAARFLNCCR